MAGGTFAFPLAEAGKLIANEGVMGIEDCCGPRHGIVDLEKCLLCPCMVWTWGTCSCECCKEKFGEVERSDDGEIKRSDDDMVNYESKMQYIN